MEQELAANTSRFVGRTIAVRCIVDGPKESNQCLVKKS